MVGILIVINGEALGWLTKDDKTLSFSSFIDAEDFIFNEELSELGLINNETGELEDIRFIPTEVKNPL